MAKDRTLLTVSALAMLLAWPPAFAQHGLAERSGVPEMMLPGSRTVIGAGNSFLSLGAQAMIARRWEEGIRFTLMGLEQPGMSDRMRASGLANLCAGYAAINESTQAIEYCTQSIELNELNWRAWSNRSYAYWLKGQYEQAGTDLERATSINARARQLFMIRGMLNEAGLKPRIQMEDRQ